VSLAGFFVAATVVTLLQFVRVREWRLLPLLALFACLAMAHSRDDWFAARPWHIAAGLAGLAILVILTPHQHTSR
jgi:hypothetical protein